ncbi:50S ribosomal protein [Dirofilaria immitis]
MLYSGWSKSSIYNTSDRSCVNRGLQSTPKSVGVLVSDTNIRTKMAFQHHQIKRHHTTPMLENNSTTIRRRHNFKNRVKRFWIVRAKRWCDKNKR